jgi:hypothetical protein
MHKRAIILFVYIGLVILCLGCNHNTSIQKNTELDNNWGRSYETAKYRQILNPDASKNLEPVVNLDGQASEASFQKYRDTFKEKRRQETVNILKLQ